CTGPVHGRETARAPWRAVGGHPRGDQLMRNAPRFVVLAAAVAALAGCASGGILDRQRPDEFAVQRQAPLYVPPDFELVPPAPGSPRPTEGTAAQQAMYTLFGGPAQRSAVDNSALQQAGAAEP